MKERELEREILSRYDSIARRFECGVTTDCGCSCGGQVRGENPGTPPQGGLNVASGTRPEMQRHSRPAKAAHPDPGESGLGCARLDALVELFPGEVLLDVGSGPGLETAVLARRVAPAWAFGLDPLPRMNRVASRNAQNAGARNVTFIKGSVEDIPLADESVDVVVSNCVINLAADKERAMREVMRVLRPGGRIAIADIVWLSAPSPSAREDAGAWASCVGGALQVDEYPRLLAEAGFVNPKVDVLHTMDATSSFERCEQGTDSGLDDTCRASTSEGACGRGSAVTPVGVAVPSVGMESPDLASAFVRARKPGAPDGGVGIRAAEPGDLAVVMGILEAAGLPTAGVEERFRDFVVARAPDGTIVGMAGVERYESSALLRSVVVLPRWRGLGVGRRLVTAQLSQLAAGTRVYLLTTTAEAYFHSLGFRRVSEGDVLEEVRESSEFRGVCPKSATMMGLVVQ